MRAQQSNKDVKLLASCTQKTWNANVDRSIGSRVAHSQY